MNTKKLSVKKIKNKVGKESIKINNYMRDVICLELQRGQVVIKRKRERSVIKKKV